MAHLAGFLQRKFVKNIAQRMLQWGFQMPADFDLSFSEPGDDDMDDEYTDMAIEFNLVNNQESEWDQ